MSDLAEIREAILKFRNERDWEQFHNAKDLALAISIEAGELLEQFLWKLPDDAEPDRVEDEIADIFIYLVLISDRYGFDIRKIVYEKLRLNDARYPVSKSKGNATKYNRFESND